MERTASALSDNAGNTTRLATVVANATADASNSVQSVASATEEIPSSVREISAQVQESNCIAESAVKQADETDAPSAKQLSDSTTSLQAEIDGFLRSITAAA